MVRPLFWMPLARVVPALRLFMGPLRRTMETVPPVVGAQERGTLWPAVTAPKPPLGVLKAFCAAARRGSATARKAAEKRIVARR